MNLGTIRRTIAVLTILGLVAFLSSSDQTSAADPTKTKAPVSDKAKEAADKKAMEAALSKGSNAAHANQVNRAGDIAAQFKTEKNDEPALDKTKDRTFNSSLNLQVYLLDDNGQPRFLGVTPVPATGRRITVPLNGNWYVVPIPRQGQVTSTNPASGSFPQQGQVTSTNPASGSFPQQGQVTGTPPPGSGGPLMEPNYAAPPPSAGPAKRAPVVEAPPPPVAQPQHGEQILRAHRITTTGQPAGGPLVRPDVKTNPVPPRGVGQTSPNPAPIPPGVGQTFPNPTPAPFGGVGQTPVPFGGVGQPSPNPAPVPPVGEGQPSPNPAPVPPAGETQPSTTPAPVSPPLENATIKPMGQVPELLPPPVLAGGSVSPMPSNVNPANPLPMGNGVRSDIPLSPDAPLARGSTATPSVKGTPAGTPALTSPVQLKSVFTLKEIRTLVEEINKERIPGLSIEHHGGLTDAFMEPLTDARDLKLLALCNTSITDEGVQWVSKIQGLQTLILESPGVTDNGLAVLKSLPKIRFLHLGGSTFTFSGDCLKHLAEVRQLKTLRLRNPGLDENEFKQLVSLPNLSAKDGLEKLDVTSTSFTDAFAPHLKNLNGLKGLRLCLTSITDAGIQHIKELKGLKTLVLDHYTDGVNYNNLYVENLNAVVVYDRVGNPIVRNPGAPVPSKLQLKFMTPEGAVVVPTAKLGIAGLKSLRELSEVTDLAIGSEIDDFCLDQIGQMKQLKALRIHTHSISNDGLDGLKYLSQLETLDIKGTRTTGATAVNLKNLTKLKAVYISAGSSSMDLNAFRSVLTKATVYMTYDRNFAATLSVGGK